MVRKERTAGQELRRKERRRALARRETPVWTLRGRSFPFLFFFVSPCTFLAVLPSCRAVLFVFLLDSTHHVLFLSCDSIYVRCLLRVVASSASCQLWREHPRTAHEEDCSKLWRWALLSDYVAPLFRASVRS